MKVLLLITKTEVRGFLGLARYYQRFTLNVAQLTAPWPTRPEWPQIRSIACFFCARLRFLVFVWLTILCHICLCNTGPFSQFQNQVHCFPFNFLNWILMTRMSSRSSEQFPLPGIGGCLRAGIWWLDFSPWARPGTARKRDTDPSFCRPTTHKRRCGVRVQCIPGDSQVYI